MGIADGQRYDAQPLIVDFYLRDALAELWDTHVDDDLAIFGDFYSRELGGRGIFQD